MSRNFLDRYRLRALVVELIELDNGETPLENRNIDWLIDRYFEHILPRSLHNRIITDPSLEREISREPRHPRHVSRAEIRGYFASQAEWLLANQLASNSNSANVRLVDIRQWISFCLQVRTEVADAKNSGVRWGVPHRIVIDLSNSLSQNLAKYGQTEAFWAKRLDNVSQQKPGKIKQSKVSCRSHLCIGSSWFLLPVLSVEVYLPRLSYSRPQPLLSLINSSMTQISPRHLQMPRQIPKMNHSIQSPGCLTSVLNLQKSPMAVSCGAAQGRVVIIALIY